MDKITLTRLGYRFDADSGLLEPSPITGSLHVPKRIFGSLVKHIGDYAFAQKDYETIFIPNSVLSLGDGAFSSNRIVNLEIPANVKSIGRFCFNANRLEEVYLSDGVETIGQEAFGVNYYLRKIYIPPSVVAIADDAFYDTNDSFVTVCVKDSYAHKYAEERGLVELVTYEEYENYSLVI